MTWREDAACLGADPELFFPGVGKRGGFNTSEFDAKRTAMAICEACPVREPCLAHAVNHPEPLGIWSGTTERERRAIRERQGGVDRTCPECGTPFVGAPQAIYCAERCLERARARVRARGNIKTGPLERRLARAGT